jgi:hypothetical protein
VSSQTGIKDVARRPAVPTAASEKGEPNVQEILCQEDVKDRTYTHIIDVPGAVISTPTVLKTDRPTAWQARPRPGGLP